MSHFSDSGAALIAPFELRKKLWRTRLALGKVQISYFYSLREWRSLFLCCVVSMSRIFLDLKRKMIFLWLNEKVSCHTKMSENEISDWGSVIVRLKSLEKV
jgi:hypothetical protein